MLKQITEYLLVLPDMLNERLIFPLNKGFHTSSDVSALPGQQQFPLMLRKSYVTMEANSSLSVSTIRLCLVMGVS